MLGKWKQSLSLCLALLFVLAVGAEAQTAETSQSQLPASVVTVSLAGEQARFTAPAGVTQMRIEVFTDAGEKVFDSDFKPGNLLDWPFQDQQGQRLADGSYRCVIMTKDLAGRLAQKRGEVRMQAGTATFENPNDETQTSQERGSSNAVSREAFLAILRDGVTRATAVLAHDGDKGRLVSGSGGLSFRAGDFFAGKDVEQMRLTPEGDLGIGVEKPAARLDVGGLIRTSEGIVFPDGTVQTTAAHAGQAAKDGTDGKNGDKGAARSPNSRDAVNADGTFDNLTVNKSLNVDQANTNNGAVNPGITFGAASGEGIASKRTVGGNRFGLDFYTAFAPRMSITQLGNVGIGTANPRDKLHVSGGGLRLDNNRGLFISDAAGAAKRALLMDASNVLHIGSGGPLGVERIDFDLGSAGNVMTVNGGKVGIGTFKPLAKLEVAGNEHIGISGTGKDSGVLGTADFRGVEFTTDNRPLTQF